MNRNLSTEEIQQILDQQRATSELHKKTETQINHKHAAFLTKNDPEWIKKVSEKNKELAQDPLWQQAQQQGSKEFWSSEQGREIKRQIQTERWQDPGWRKKMTQALNDRYQDGTLGHKISQALKNSTKCKENGLRNRKPLQTPDGVFDSRKAAAEFYKIDTSGINRRIKRYPDQYYYTDTK